jgi:predicted O-methyltransferase YrrM
MGRKLLEAIKYSPVSRIATLPLRMRSSMPMLARNAVRTIAWVFGAREWVNFDFDYDPLGVISCAGAISAATGVDPRVVRRFADELKSDHAFAERCRQRVTSTRLRYVTDRRVHYGHPMYFYMAVRATKPGVVFEAGTDKGLGALAVCRALERNRAEGTPGRLTTIDLASDRGDYLDGNEGGLATRLTGDSVVTLAAMKEKIDFFIHETVNDSDHTRAQLAALEPRLAPRGLVLTCWFSQEFVDFCERNDLAYLEVVERPKDHWYAGRRMGLAWAPRDGATTA